MSNHVNSSCQADLQETSNDEILCESIYKSFDTGKFGLTKGFKTKTHLSKHGKAKMLSTKRRSLQFDPVALPSQCAESIPQRMEVIQKNTFSNHNKQAWKKFEGGKCFLPVIARKYNPYSMMSRNHIGSNMPLKPRDSMLCNSNSACQRKYSYIMISLYNQHL